MNRSPLTSRRILLATALLLLVNSMLGRPWAETVGRPLSDVSDTIFAPVTGGLRAVSLTVLPAPSAHRYANDRELAEVIADRDEYRAMAAALEDQVQRLRETVASLQNFREQVDLEAVRIVQARVLSYNGNARNPVITIDRGNSSGVVGGLSVERDGNLVGVVSSAGPRTADVTLLSRAGARLRAVIRPADPDAVPYELVEMLQSLPDASGFFVDVGRDGPGAVGDYAHLADTSGLFPVEAQGRILGRVAEVRPIPAQPLLKRLVILPTLPLARLSRVLVVVPMQAAGEAAP